MRGGRAGRRRGRYPPRPPTAGLTETVPPPARLRRGRRAPAGAIPGPTHLEDTQGPSWAAAAGAWAAGRSRVSVAAAPLPRLSPRRQRKCHRRPRGSAARRHFLPPPSPEQPSAAQSGRRAPQRPRAAEGRAASRASALRGAAGGLRHTHTPHTPRTPVNTHTHSPTPPGDASGPGGASPEGRYPVSAAERPAEVPTGVATGQV